MRSVGLDPNPALVLHLRTRKEETAMEQMMQMLQGGSPPDAIITEYPVALATALRSAGARFDDICIAGWMSRPGAVVSDEDRSSITAVAACDYSRLGEKAGELLVRRMENPKGAVRLELVSPTIEIEH